MTAEEQMISLVKDIMLADGVTQAELARRIGRTPKHVNKVLSGSAGSRELDYWLFCLGYEFVVTKKDLQNDPKKIMKTRLNSQDGMW